MYCSAALPVQRWRAESPPGLLPRVGKSPTVPRTRAYPGPPSYGDRPPRWGYPPVVWQVAAVPVADTSRDAPIAVLRIGFLLCALTGAAALAAAGGEMWRYVLLLRGRTAFLSGAVVSASDRLVTIASAVTMFVAVATAIVVATAFVRLHAGAARRAGAAPSRPPAAVLARLVVPGWNIYGLGVVAGEIDGLLAMGRDGAGRRPRPSRLVLTWWAAWGINAVLVLVTLVRAFGRSDQAVADTVELHIWVDLAGALTAVLAALVCRRFRRLLRGPADGVPAGWLVRPPEPTRGRPDQPAMSMTAPGNPAAGPAASQATVSASAVGDQPDEEAEPAHEPEPTTMTPIP